MDKPMLLGKKVKEKAFIYCKGKPWMFRKTDRFWVSAEYHPSDYYFAFLYSKHGESYKRCQFLGKIPVEHNEMTVNIEVVANTIKMKARHIRPCKKCRGEGRYDVLRTTGTVRLTFTAYKCEVCKGSGIIIKLESVPYKTN